MAQHAEITWKQAEELFALRPAERRHTESARTADRPRIHRDAMYVAVPSVVLEQAPSEQLIARHRTAAQRPITGKGRWRSYRTMTSTSHRVFRFLVRITKRYGKCNPAISVIARRTDCGRMTVFRALRELERGGWITIIKRRQKLKKDGQILECQATNAYEVHDPKSALGPVVKS